MRFAARPVVTRLMLCALSLVVAAPLAAAPPAPAATPITVTILGNADLHGRVERLPILTAEVNAIRAEVKAHGGGVVFVDAGDLFQGTLESNLVEGKSVIEAYNILKPDAAAVGNHEFDYGPAGALTIPKSAKDDPRGALKARIAEAKFPFLAANLIDEKTNKPVGWPNTKPSVLVTTGGVKVGIIGVTTIDTPHTTSATNFKGLKMLPLREAIASEADALRKKGAAVIVVAAHAGGGCTKLDDPNDLSSCDNESEVFNLARSLPLGLVDAIVAAHTHQAVAHIVNGIPIIEAWANGKGFGRLELEVTGKKVTLKKIYAPHASCMDDNAAVCEPAELDGKPVVPDAKVAAVVAPYVESARKAKEKRLGVQVKSEVKRGYDQESALGNLFADLMLEGARDAGWAADVGIINGGGIRANFPAGDLTYGQVFEMTPFDNRYAKISTTGKILREWLESNLGVRKGGILSVAGVTAKVTCEGKRAHAVLKRTNGAPLGDDEKILIVTTDFLATGGEATKLPPGSVVLDESDPIREYVARMLEKHGGVLDGDDHTLFDTAHRRLDPGRCKGE